MASSSANPRRKKGYKRDKLWKRVRAERRPCHLCGYPIDYDAGYLDKRSFQLDELDPVSKGGDHTDYANVDAAHRCCNQWRGNRRLTPRLCAEIRARYEREILGRGKPVRHSRKW